MSTDKQTLSELPPRLIEALRDQDGPTPLVPRSVERVVLDQAEAHFGARRGTPRRWALPAAAAAAAAIVLAAVLVVQPFEPAPERQTVANQMAKDTAGQIADDIDGSGAVDVLDAFLMARQRMDDPSITQERIDAILARIVSLSEEDHRT